MVQVETWGKMHPQIAHADRLPRAFAISLGLVPAEAAYACKIRGAQIEAVARLSPLAMVANCLICAILLLTLNNTGVLGLPMLVWGIILGVSSLNYLRSWARTRRTRPGPRAASRKAVWRAVLHAGMFGALWGAVPIFTYSGSPSSVQVVVGCTMAGMMCAGGFMLATVPLAGMVYVAMIVAGGTIAVAGHVGGAADLGLLASLWVYASVVVTCLCCNAHLFVEHFLAVARLKAEITAREQAQAEVARSQRMSALGTLAGGVAHDFNNILQSVTGNATLLARRAGDPRQARLLARSILDAAERGGAISRRLLSFARQDALSAEPVAIGAILHNAAELLEHTLHRSITLGVYAPADLPAVLADKAQLETVLVNLAANARDAMPRGGTLSFHAIPQVVGECGIGPNLPSGRYVRLEVIDNGVGMDAATLARACEPFFTTKPQGKGTGLGLAMAHRFAEQSGGAMSIASEPGLGTVVTLWLPQSLEVAPAMRPGFVPPQIAAETRRVLVVDDDTDVRESLVRTLEDAGFDAFGVAHAAVAKDLVERGLDIDLIITDFSMPGIDGIELLEDVQARRPDLPAILLTGLVGDVIEGSCARFVVLQKPVGPHVLLQHVWEALALQVVT